MLGNDYMDTYVSRTVLALAKVVGAAAITVITVALASCGVGGVAQIVNTIIATLATTKEW